MVNAQVSFTQNTNADFLSGVLNNTVVGSNTVYLQNAASDVGTWLTTTVLPQTLTGQKTVSWNDRFVYMIGGYNNANYVNTVYVATIQAGGITGWSALNPLPVALRDPAVVIGTNTIYVMGGRNGSQVYNTIYYATLNADGSIGAWQTSSVTLPANLWGHTATYMMGYIYVVGGSSSMTENTALNTVYYTKVNALNTLSTFTTGINLTSARNRHSTITYNNKLYVLGGYDNTGTKSNTVYIATPTFDGNPGSWTAGANLPVAISNHSAVVTNGIITIMAGAVGSTLSNTVYYANADAGTLTWITSSYLMYDYTKDGAAFAGNGLVFYSGGTNLSGTAIFNCRYALMTMTTNYVNHGAFVSNPFYQLGAERPIDSVTFTKTLAGTSSFQITYRTAGADGIFSDWTTLATASPLLVSQTKQYLQYATILTGVTTNNATLNQIKLFTRGTQLSGNLNAITTFTKALSPYWATGDISFTGGTHTFQAGTTILFLPNTGMTVSQANIICNGTAVDSVKFTYFTSEVGKWNGLYFDGNSDVGVSSQFYYTVISNAGNGSNNANLYCNSTSEPLLSHCSIMNSGSNGINLTSSNISIQKSIIKGNGTNGIYLNASNPILDSTNISYNLGAGVYYTSTSSVPNFSASSCTIDHNLYGFRYPSPNFTFTLPNGFPTVTGNTYNGIAIDAGDISSNQRWYNIPYDYILLGTIRLVQYSGAARLTIEPGNTIKVVSGAQIQVGLCGSYGGELYALGTIDSLITFTSHNGLPGGWNGIYFTDCSDNWGGQTQMDYCVIEKGNDYNYFSEYTTQPNLINHSIIRNSLNDGARYSVAYGSITNCQFLNNGRYPLYLLNPEANPVHTNNTYTGNTINRITLNGGNFNGFDRTLTNDNATYYVLNDIILMNYGSYSRLTVNPGITVEFAVGKKLQVGIPASSYGGSLFAQGTAINPIIFKAFNNTPGGWGGIYFPDQNDNWGGTSILEYCTITQGSTYNICAEVSNQPSLNHCIISNSASHGIVETQSSMSIQNCQFLNNNGYPLKYNDWSCNSFLNNNTYTGNTNNYIALSGGDYTSDRLLYNDGISYHVLGDIRVYLYSSYSRLTLTPGITLLFNPGTKLQIGASNSYGGSLYAKGTVDSIITFKPFNNTIGGWNGIYFTEWNDNWGGTSIMEYCTITQGSLYNINCESSGQPSMNHCIISNSASHGIIETSSSISIQNCQFLNNNGYPLKYNDWPCNSYLKNNTYIGNTINYIALSGGDYTSDRFYYNDGIPYHILSDIRVFAYSSHSRITLSPGITFAFNPGVKLQLGLSNAYGGDIWAEGTPDSIITFKPYNNTPGGWAGIYFTEWNDNWGGNSLLKYCTITQGANYNINCEYSYQPTINHCTISQSTGSGLIIYNSSLNIRNSTFTKNATYGIYVDGSGTANIGNADSLSSNIYSNGLMDLYNNSTADINARYNYWGTSDSVMISLRIYDKSENPAKGRVYFTPFLQLPFLTTPTTTMNGVIKYANTGSNLIKNATMVIKNFQDTVIATTASNTSGLYTFSSFPSGSYKMTITPAAPWGGVNSTDALLVLNHFAQINLLTGLNLSAADVNNSHTINGTDALFIMKRYSGLITSFPSGDYLYHSDTVIVNGNQITNNIRMICYGDVNASNTPAKKSSSTVGLVHEGSLLVSSFDEFDLTVKLKTGMQIGAASLGFYFPKEYIDIVGAKLVNGNTGFPWSSIDGLFKMGWCDINSLNINNDGVVIILRIKTKDLSSLTSSIALDIFEECEFADPLAIPNEMEVVSIPTITTTALGIELNNSITGLSVYPNPITAKSIISFNLDKPGNIQITLVDILGHQINEIVSGNYTSGNHQVELYSKGLKPGIYFLKYTYNSNNQTISDIIKLVVSN